MAVTISGTNGIAVPLGTAAAPGVVNTTSATTGIYNPTSTTLGLSTNGTNAVYINSSQNVGIGTSSPTVRLHVAGATQNTDLAIFTGGGNLTRGLKISTFAAVNNDAGVLLDAQTTTNGAFALATAGTERMRIDSNGVLLVGTTSTFDVTSGATTQLSGQCAVYNSGSPNTLMSFYNSTQSARVGYIGSSGNSTSYNSGSDYRLKENVANINGALSTISAMRPITFTWKISPETGVFSGFIAHELQEICPEAVGGAKDAMCDDGVTPNYQMVDQSKLVPLLVAAIKELSAEVEALKAKVGA